MNNKNDVSDYVAATMNAIINSAEHRAIFGSNYKYAQDNRLAQKVDSLAKSLQFVPIDENLKNQLAFPPSNPVQLHKIVSDVKDAIPNDHADKKQMAEEILRMLESDKNGADDTRKTSKCEKCSKDKDSCMCGDSSLADDNDARRKAKKCEECSKPKSECKCGDSSSADDNDARKKKEKEESSSSSDSSSADDADVKVQAALSVAIDSLLVASAALDSIGMEKSATVSLQVAGFVIEAKKKKEKSSKDSNDAKAKAKAKADKEKADKAKAKEKAELEKAKAKDKADKEKAKAKLEKEKADAKAKAEKEKAKAKAEKEKSSKK